MNSYTLYWGPETWNQKQNDEPLFYIAGESLANINKGDEVFIVNVKNNRLFIGGRIISSGVAVDFKTASKHLNNINLIEKKQYVIADENHQDFFRANLSLDATDVRKIEIFEKKTGGIFYCKFSKTSFQQDFRPQRRISERSASKLRSLLEIKIQDSEEMNDLVVYASPVDEPPEKRVLREILARRGQPEFRNNLLDAYGKACCVTGCKVIELLEAAHIDPHSEGGNYSLQNGLLLRSDIHTLFDQYLLAFDEFKRIVVSKKLKKTEYEIFHMKRLLSPTPSIALSKEALARRYAEFLIKEQSR